MTGLMIGAVLISFSSVMVVLAGLPPDVTGFYRLFVGGLGMLCILWRMDKLRFLSAEVWRWAFLAAVFFALDFVCWHRSIALVGPGLATMLVNFQVLILAGVSVTFLKEKASLPFLAAIPMAILGLYLMVGVSWDAFTPEYRVGVVYGLLTALAYALYLLSLKYTISRAGADPLAMSGAVALLTGLMLGAISLAQGESFAIPSLQSLAAILTLALVCHAVGWFLISKSMQRVRTSLVGLILLLQPTLSFVWDILFFGKPANPMEIGGVALALVAIYLGSMRRSK